MNIEQILYYEKNNNTMLFDTLKQHKIIKKIQNYIPIYNKFFKLNETNWNSINLNHTQQIHNIHIGSVSGEDIHSIQTFTIQINSKEYEYSNKKVQSFFKFSPLIDPVKYLTNKYNNDCSNNAISNNTISELPTFLTKDVVNNNPICNKINNPYNVSYVDGFFYFLSNILHENHNIHNCIQYYGSFLAIKEYFKYDICDDIETIIENTNCMKEENKVFYIDKKHIHKIDLFNKSLKHKPKISINSICNTKIDNIDKELDFIDGLFETNEIIHTNTLNNIDTFECHTLPIKECDICFNMSCIPNDYSDEDDIDDENSVISYTTSENESDESEDDSDSNNSGVETNSKHSNVSISTNNSNDEDDDETIDIFIKDFPVEIICVEKLEHTLDSYIEKNEIDQEEWISILAQIIMNLIIYNKCFDFTHNDLHTNNIMFVSTEKQYVCYKFNAKHYKIPTYGKIWKIIDFGRSIYTFRGQHIYSDSYFKNGDADGQYNFGSFYNPNKPEIKPNKSFDLSRLGCSLFDYFIDSMDELNDPDIKNDILVQLIIDWCKDDNGLNILYKSNGSERYPGFKLYKMITRNIHHCIPSNEIEKPIFQNLIVSKKKINKRMNILNIDTLPDYTKK